MKVCLDACFLIGLYDESDQHHVQSTRLFTELFSNAHHNVAVIVWPVLYEAVSTQLVKNRRRTAEMERDWRKLIATRRLAFLDDQPYRDAALEMCLQQATQTTPAHYRTLSLTDRVLRGVMADANVSVDAILTFNTGDFADVCKRSGRQIVA